MEQKIISACHSLRLIPISRLVRFGRYQSEVRLVHTGLEIPSKAIPGTVKVSTQAEDGVYKKQITYLVGNVLSESVDWMTALKFQRLVAVYVDEGGSARVCGSPDFPLSLDFISGDGVLSVTLSGQDREIDGFLVD